MNILKKYKKWEREVYKKKAWNIGFLDYDESTVFKPFKIAWLDWRGYDKGWFADPFILSVDGNRIEVLVEEMMLDKPPATVFQAGRRRQATRRWGRISKLEITRGKDGRFVLEKVVPVIEDKLHYSFPAIYRADGKIFIHPENGESGVSPLFVYDEKTGTATRAGTLSEAPLARTRFSSTDFAENGFASRRASTSQDATAEASSTFIDRRRERSSVLTKASRGRRFGFPTIPREAQVIF